ncbi:MAG: hypothetical protein J3Q66DRAFT_385640 [Benniella sp.]|nr:MAG: hypothetical protein J3Q66DRAFT_385640 [Benniella sp.]
MRTHSTNQQALLDNSGDSRTRKGAKIQISRRSSMELWHAPIPGSSREAPSHPTVARCRQEDRMLDRQELLKNDILPTTCGICFDSFTPLELDSQPPRERPVSSRAQFALSFAARLARSLALVDFNQHHDPSSSSSTSQRIPGAYTSSPFFSSSPLPAQQQQQQQQPTETFSSSSPPSSPTPSDNPSSSTNASCTDQQQQPPTQQQSTVTPSMSSKDIGIVMPCDHGLCLSCLQSFLTSATQNPQARFPTLCPQPGCRTPIPTESAELVLNSETLEIWHRKLAEVHVANKVCCPKPECQSIIDLDDRHGTAVTCPECKSSYCASCAVPFHHGYTCDQYQAQRNDSEADRAMLQLVEDRHWRHCPSCRFVIEKQQGCNHMVCHCGQSFCYACGHAWNEIEARCSSGCERYGDNEQDDAGVECRIM